LLRLQLVAAGGESKVRKVGARIRGVACGNVIRRSDDEGVALQKALKDYDRDFASY
jgi:hypothetical protein